MTFGQFEPPSVTSILGRGIDACDSAIEDVFLWEFSKVRHDHVAIGRQHECDVGYTSYWLDFLLTHEGNGKKIAIECDGKEFHTVSRDSKRDAAIIRAGIVDQIVRIPGRDIWFRIHDVFQMIGSEADWLFSPSGITNTRVLAAREHMREDYWGRTVEGVYLEQIRAYEKPDEEGNIFYDYEWWEFKPTKLLWARRGEQSAAANS